jgi:hypothetical protein
LVPFSYFCTCWNVKPIASPSLVWLILSIILRIRTRTLQRGAASLRRRTRPGPAICQQSAEADSPSEEGAYIDDFLATSDGLSLTKYFMRIKNPKLRRCIVDLVEQIATRYN